MENSAHSLIFTTLIKRSREDCDLLQCLVRGIEDNEGHLHGELGAFSQGCESLNSSHMKILIQAIE